MYSGSPACFQTGPDCVGATEVQAVARTQVCLTMLVGAHRATRPQALCFVGTGGATPRLDYRSRMRRESHVRFCEGGGVRLPSATRFSRSAALPVCHPERSSHFFASGVEGSTRSDFFFPARFQTNRFAAIPPRVRFGLRLARLVGMTNKGARENRQSLVRGRDGNAPAISKECIQSQSGAPSI